MTRLLIIVDGMADLPGNETDHLMATLHSIPVVGTALTETDADKTPSSERAIMSLLGYDIAGLHISRSRLEALALGIDTTSKNIYRVNLTSPDGLPANVSDEEARALAMTLGPQFHPMDRYRMLMTTSTGATPDIPDGLTIIQGEQQLDSVNPLTIPTRIIGATHLVEGIAKHTGAIFSRPAGATGHIDTDIAAKAVAAKKSVSDGMPLTIVHIEAADEAAHRRDPELKAKILKRVDRLLIAPLLSLGVPLTVCADHITDATTGRHHQGAVTVRSTTPSPDLRYLL